MAESLVRRARRAVRPPCGVLSQLQALNLGEVWQNVAAPVLVIRGSKDTVMSRADSSAIAETVNRVHPGKARYLEMEGMTHGFTVAKEAASSRAGEMGRLKNNHRGGPGKASRLPAPQVNGLCPFPIGP